MANIAIEKENIFLNLQSTTKEEAIRLAGNKLLEAGYVADGYVESMLHREELLTTYMDYGVAIPHGDRESQQLIIQSGIVFLQFKDGIDFGNGNKAELLIASAGKGNNHLRILSGLAKLLKKTEIVDLFISTNDKEIVYNELIKYIK
ncbi:PTS sugar transporter subunit IIA [Helcococcus ovis]|uniref:Mannitol-specific phosphotransferase enzyme IIA component n=1 Tax=Helcococcus ovis TaxID=72026 RepID=A0A4R9C4F8_9FIRM|nr:PTS sugar transporter subunit IIA [Helcococcus ovis]TFF64342.1 PTS mannitol transporter subunit IIA [Helcococcus ovis]TFF66476.1 PTS mannitol transporter subunit IIA [Helcococcus ovis]TFF67037.1 PTS mannitol transporter subunit IIA [Helcococcus ovis]WNZ01829.1 PTS sugar transporter subunit IIA [Helcococcus ovis]